VLLAAGPASAEWFLKIEGVPGGSRDATHAGWIDVQSFSIGGMSSQTLESGQRASSAARGGPDTLTLTKSVDTATPNLMKASTERRRFQAIVFECRKSGGARPVKYMEFKLKEVIVTSVTKGGSSGFPTETIKMTYGAIEWTYTAQTPPTPTHATVTPVAIAPKR
jgi:type VI secretion system Hcp family effector